VLKRALIKTAALGDHAKAGMQARAREVTVLTSTSVMTQG